jgi:single-stranded-DNA-specific exonuclease
MEPFGPENMRPVFIAKNVLDTGYSKIVKEDHIRFVVKQDKYSFTGIGFNLAAKFGLLKNKVDLVFTLDENEWNGNTSLQLKIIDLRRSE